MKHLILVFLIFQLNYNYSQGNGSLVACYALNGNGYEPVNNLQGVLNKATAAPGRLNVPNTGLVFNGINKSHVELPAHSLLKTNIFSFSAWVKPLPGFFSKGYIVFCEGYALSYEDVQGFNKFRVTKKSGTNSVSLLNTTPLNTNNWYHVCFTMDNSTIKIYLNGMLENTTTTTLSISYQNNKKVFLGATGDTLINNPFSGILDNVKFYNKALDGTEVSQLYTADIPCVIATQSPVASFSVNPYGLCKGQPVKFTDQSTNDPDMWHWTIPGGITNNAFDVNPTYTFNTVGSYTANLVVSNSLGSDSIQVPFTINPLPTITAVASKTSIGRYMPVTIYGGGAVTYTWMNSSIGDSLTISPANNTTVTVKGTDINGCTNTASVQIKVSHVHDLREKSNLNGLKVFPNPTTGILNIENVIQNLNYTVFNSVGSIVIRDEIKDRRIDISTLPGGLYSVLIRAGNSHATFKIIKE